MPKQEDWTLNTGEQILRVHLHGKYGGSGQGGINPSNKTPNIFIFSDPDTGHQHGYHDHWSGDAFYYVGEGQKGDQQMIRGNRQILEHKAKGRVIRLFQGSRGTVTYMGRFQVDDRDPYQLQNAPQKEGGVRKVIVFRLIEDSE
jgi:hypothetical protein